MSFRGANISFERKNVSCSRLKTRNFPSAHALICFLRPTLRWSSCYCRHYFFGIWCINNPIQSTLSKRFLSFTFFCTFSNDLFSRMWEKVPFFHLSHQLQNSSFLLLPSSQAYFSWREEREKKFLKMISLFDRSKSPRNLCLINAD